MDKKITILYVSFTSFRLEIKKYVTCEEFHDRGTVLAMNSLICIGSK